jgi:hypothetical protein
MKTMRASKPVRVGQSGGLSRYRQVPFIEEKKREAIHPPFPQNTPGAPAGAPGHGLPEELERLASVIAGEGRLVLFLGAGINGKAVPQWPALLRSLLRRALRCSLHPPATPECIDAVLQRTTDEHDGYAQASIAEMLLGSRRFPAVLRGEIYGQCDFARLRTSCCYLAGWFQSAWVNESREPEEFGLLCSIARLCLAREVIAVVTYNFDTLLEFAIEAICSSLPGDLHSRRTRRPVSFGGTTVRESWAQARGQNVLPVYHVHGCLHPPRGSKGLADYPAVISEHDYARMMHQPHSWEDTSQLHFLRNYPCLFLGLSMADWNILRLLEAAVEPSKEERPTGSVYCVGATAHSDSEADLQLALKRRLLAGFGVQAAFANPGQFSEIRAFTDTLFFQLERNVDSQRINHEQ